MWRRRRLRQSSVKPKGPEKNFAKAEASLFAIEGQDFADIELVTDCDGGQAGLRILVKGEDLTQVRGMVDSLLALLASAEAEYDSNN